MSSFPDIHAIERSRIVDKKKREKKFLELPYNPSYLATRPGYAGKAHLLSICTGILGNFDILQFEISSLMNWIFFLV